MVIIVDFILKFQMPIITDNSDITFISILLLQYAKDAHNDIPPNDKALKLSSLLKERMIRDVSNVKCNKWPVWW